MASVFTFEPDPPRVSSPWSAPPLNSQAPHSIPQDSTFEHARPWVERQQGRASDDALPVDYGIITKLEAEPQEGPTEYKLHLLLRRRRSFTYYSTGRHISGSLRRSETPTPSPLSYSGSEQHAQLPLSSIPSRQHRLEQLTTQLLWRLQQSCPHHTSSSTTRILPRFPDERELGTPVVPQALLPGLEESRGALYEIGVADDGTFVGLVEDEMEESLNTLRAMAASLGCRVDVLRMVTVGECEWTEEMRTSGARLKNVCAGKLWVAEAFVHPERHPNNGEDASAPQKDAIANANHVAVDGSSSGSYPTSAQQLRISCTGATTSGKSSLLGSLSTSTLDNGRGKSRLSLLKHRHEIASGMTSSVTQELIGYRDVIDQEGTRTCTQVISYGAGNVSSWADIHTSAGKGSDGRLVFISDSAGHLRYRRTTVRGLVGWDPHWTLLCMPANNTDESGQPVADLDLSQTHLQLCLRLELPLVVVITKYDLANLSTLRQILSKLLTPIKDAGRKPCIIPTSSGAFSDADLNTISASDLLQADEIVQTIQASPLSAVPIVFTSAVNGTGINKLHALLRELPVPCPQLPPPGAPRTLFYIEDVYGSIAAPSTAFASTSGSTDHPVIIGGHLRHGTLTVGDELLLGPYHIDAGSDDSDSGSGRASARSSPVPTSRSFPGALHKTQLRVGAYAHDKHAEWRRVRIASLRNLRLPVRSLSAGQVGTMGVVPVDVPIASPAVVRVRKGMVVQSGGAKATRLLSARFSGPNAATVANLTVGNAVVVYVASVRASAKVVSVATETSSRDSDSDVAPGSTEDDEDATFGFGFGFDEDPDNGASAERPPTNATIVTFQFIGSREFVEMDAKVLVLPGGGPGLSGGTERGEKGVAGLEGFVGRVIEGRV